MDEARGNPSIDPTAFPSTPSNYFWSSAPLAGSLSYAGFVYFYYGSAGYDDVVLRVLRTLCAMRTGILTL